MILKNKWYCIAKTSTIDSKCSINISFETYTISASVGIGYGDSFININEVRILKNITIGIRLIFNKQYWEVDIITDSDIENITVLLSNNVSWIEVLHESMGGTILCYINDICGFTDPSDNKFDKGNILTADSEELETDENVYSAARAKLEDDKRLRKDIEDVSAERITFEKGLKSVGKTEVEKLETVSYTEGFGGAGFTLKKREDGTTFLEVDHLSVRRSAKFYELIIQQLKHQGGIVFYTAAAIECVSVTEEEDGYKCFFDTKSGSVHNEFEIGDQARCQRFSGTLKYYWRLVAAIGDDFITLSKSDCDTGSGIPEGGDIIVQLGNRDNSSRQAAKVTTVIGNDAPRDEFYEGISNYDLIGKLITVVGVNNGKTGIFTKHGRFEGDVILGAGSSGLKNLPEWDDTKLQIQYSIDGSTWHNTVQEGDIYMRQKAGADQVWSNAIKIKGDKGEKGERGLQGLQGTQGLQGIAGAKGADGATTYFHIKYSPVASPTAAQMTETPDTFIGTYVDTTAADSNDPTKYTWARFQGLQGATGEKGIPGVNGANGQTSYLHIKYSDNGTSFTANNGETPGAYIGQYTDFTEADSSVFSEYTWMKVKGDTGQDGTPGEILSAGRMIYRDPEFRQDLNGCYTYNNTGNDNVLLARIAKPDDCPTTSTHCLEIKTIGVASPEHGGYVQYINARPNAIFIQKIVAKIPVGYSLKAAANALGTGFSDKFLTPVAGTGKYETYIRKTVCGTGGNFANGGYLHLVGGYAPVTWYVASSTVYDLTDSEKWDADISALKNFTDEAFADGIIDRSEAVAIEKYKNTVNESFNDLVETYRVVYSNTYLPVGTAKNNFLAAMTGLIACKDSLLNSITSAISDGKTTVTEKADVDSKYTLYTTAVGTFKTALEQANKAIQEKLDSLSSEKIDNIQVGGRNLLINSHIEKYSKNEAAGTEHMYYADCHSIFKDRVGKSVMISFDCKVDIAGSVRLYATNISRYSFVADHNFNVTTEYKRYAFPCTIKDKENTSLVSWIEFYGTYDTGRYVWVKNVKIEDGNKATDWTPATEDVTQSIATAQSTADALKNFTDVAFRDGIIDRAEAAAIEKYKNSVMESFNDLQNSHYAIYNNTYLVAGTAKNNLSAAFTGLNTCKNNLLNSITTAIADGKTTVAEKADVDNKYALYTSAVGTFKTALEQANKAIQDRLNSLSTDRVENVKPGGPNLINSSWIQETSSVYGFAARECNVTAGREYVLSAEGFVNQQALNDGKSLVIYLYNTAWSFSKALIFSTLTPTINAIAFIAPNTETLYITSYLYPRDGSRLGKATINWYQLQEGNKPSAGWSPSPGDVQAAATAEAVEKSAKELGFTKIEGGLIQSNLIKLNRLGGQETAGISGIDTDNQGKALPAFYAGGTYEKALLRQANVDIYHNGKSKLGRMFVNEDGSSIYKDSSNVDRVFVTPEDVSTLNDLIGSSQAETGVNTPASNRGVILGSYSQGLSLGSLNVTKNNADLFIKNIPVRVYVRNYTAMGDAAARVQIHLLKDGSLFAYVDTLAIDYVYDRDGVDQELDVERSITATLKVPRGVYQLMAYVDLSSTSDLISASYSIEQGRFTWQYLANVSKTEVGRNGYLTFKDIKNFLYSAVENGKLNLICKTEGIIDMPGVLAAYSIRYDGYIIKQWGAKSKPKGSYVGHSVIGYYEVPHTIGHDDYMVTATVVATGGAFVCIVRSKGATSVGIGIQDMGDNPSNQYFDIVITGRNGS